MEQKSDDETDENALKQVILVRSESSVLQEASEQISQIIQSTNKNSTIFDNDFENTNISNDNDLVRIGEITPFQAEEKNNSGEKSAGKSEKTSQLTQFEIYLKQQAELARIRKSKKRKNVSPPKNSRKKSKTIGKSCAEQIANQTNENANENYDKNTGISGKIDREKSGKIVEEPENYNDTGSEYIPSDDENFDSDDREENSIKRKNNSAKNKLSSRTSRVVDDGDEELYRERVRGTRQRQKEPMHKIDNLFKVPLTIWKNLYQYQRVSVQWLWELHNRNVGGLVGDEMGLGKTVQVIAFLAGLEASELLLDEGRFRGLGPTLIVCPATLLDQWVKHFHDWSPITRVALLHHSGTFQGDVEDLVEVIKHGGVLLTSYTGVLIHKDLLTRTEWHYVILDEGHKIRNPEAKVTKAVKKFTTPHRLLLTGSPMQNSLKELWSLFDFILPGKLGTLVAFIEHCANPITRGGYANATPLQEATALQMATMLRNAITPYMLRRTKVDVQHHLHLPEKNEQVLFCSLSDEQKKLYKEYLFASEDVSHVIHERHSTSGIYRARMLVALTALRKLCNHPDLFLFNHQVLDSDDDESMELTDELMATFGHWKRAGKMIVVRSLLKIWKKQGHRVLLFTQSRQMMHILEALVQSEKYSYLRLDGLTPMGQRQQTIQKFNTNSSYFVFLLTTRVGGLGVNLTGADRVVIYDPDWNPATDAQARERAWRIGQDKNVTIYRLITAGTIEEKIYHRQVFKLLLSNKVLEDPRQRRLFHTSDISELFNLNESFDGEAESDQLFKHSKLAAPMRKQKKKTTNFTSSKIDEMRKLASALSKEIGEKSKNVAEIAKNREITGKSREKFRENRENRKNSVESSENFHDDDAIGKIDEEIEKIDEIVKEIGNDDENEIGNFEKEIGNDEKNEIVDFENKIGNDENKIVNFENKIGSDEEIEIEINEEKIDKMENETEKLEIKIERSVENSMEFEGEKSVAKPAESSEEEGEIRDTESNKAKIEERRKKEKKKKKRRKSETKKEVSAIFEGEQVPCLIGRRLGFAKEYQEPIATEDDDYVLYKLFSKAAVSSAFQHDSVISGRNGEPFEKSLLERTAVESAQEGMEKIRNSRRYYIKPSWKSS